MGIQKDSQILILCSIKVILLGKIQNNDLKLVSYFIYLVTEIVSMLIHALLKFMLLVTKIIELIFYFFVFQIVKCQINYKPGSVI